jgi:hypothetical protein
MLLLTFILLIDVTFSTPTPVCVKYCDAVETFSNNRPPRVFALTAYRVSTFENDKVESLFFKLKTTF